MKDKEPLYIDSDGREYYDIELKPPAVVIGLCIALILLLALCIHAAYFNQPEETHGQQLNSTDRSMPDDAGGLRGD